MNKFNEKIKKTLLNILFDLDTKRLIETLKDNRFSDIEIIKLGFEVELSVYKEMYNKDLIESLINCGYTDNKIIELGYEKELNIYRNI